MQNWIQKLILKVVEFSSKKNKNLFQFERDFFIEIYFS